MTRQQVDESRAVRRALDDALEQDGAVLSRHRLPRVLHDSPAAVLLVETSTREVVQTNAAARELGPVSYTHLTLPTN